MANMVRAVDSGKESIRFAALWLMSYAFLLRMPSEALVACVGSPDTVELVEQQTLIWREGEAVCLRMRRRKNRPKGSGVLRRTCTCAGSLATQSLLQCVARCKCLGGHVATCVVHTLWDKYLAARAVGDQPWRDITPAVARGRLRQILDRLGVPSPRSFGTHDFRRGHAEVHYFARACSTCASCMQPQDMRRCGSTLVQILRAGQWKSAAFIAYMNEAALEEVPCSTSRMLV